jgi:hypothetical protein
VKRRTTLLEKVKSPYPMIPVYLLAPRDVVRALTSAEPPVLVLSVRQLGWYSSLLHTDFGEFLFEKLSKNPDKIPSGLLPMVKRGQGVPFAALSATNADAREPSSDSSDSFSRTLVNKLGSGLLAPWRASGE